jgi:hypothetical protein
VSEGIVADMSRRRKLFPASQAAKNSLLSTARSAEAPPLIPTA